MHRFCPLHVMEDRSDRADTWVRLESVLEEFLSQLFWSGLLVPVARRIYMYLLGSDGTCVYSVPINRLILMV